MPKKATYKEIAEYLDKNEGTIKNWKANHPHLLELVKLGMICKKNGIDEPKLLKVLQAVEALAATNSK